jgi:spore coat polysaccharide biosynthesis predicted glycosyltransferase SpsG
MQLYNFGDNNNDYGISAIPFFMKIESSVEDNIDELEEIFLPTTGYEMHRTVNIRYFNEKDDKLILNDSYNINQDDLKKFTINVNRLNKRYVLLKKRIILLKLIFPGHLI